ncbi:D-cysteine desulfhydrase [Cytobacillus depressus]|uniref:D-cysteine desulfhydrase n=1 Tax=Cytobacillus depressus TaxID=1602942 RepID=A0A6L3VB52_9BACI|nr:D-cysteine desulfhydrase [Cytobacillus depressus]KAB2338422.1 D-cysteine desulfhydrase [Cytobacillus depressus]
MDLTRFPRRRYTEYATPIQKLSNLSKALNGPTIYVKRDDLLGLAAGGNKTRKLEFLVADALEQGADTLITCGAVQSNHCRLTLSAAVKEQLHCHLVLEERVPESYSPEANGNNFLFKLLGADGISIVSGGTNMMEAMEEVKNKLAKEGRKAYIIPGGGSNEVGATGYVACAQELLTQTFDMGLNLDYIITASGSSGTHAGLVTGFYGTNTPTQIIGINVSRKKDEQEELVYRLAHKTAKYVGITSDVPKEFINCFDQYVGEGYSLPTPGMIEAVRLFAQHEGILLDPVYTGKVASGLIDLIRNGFFKKDDQVLFLHTGGSPALYAYDSIFFSKTS